jgi:uncharacterized protein (TIGR02594 family)
LKQDKHKTNFNCLPTIKKGPLKLKIMKAIVPLFLILITSLTCLSMSWNPIEAKVKYIYQLSNSENLEVLKLYDNNSFEHLVYHKDLKGIIVNRNIGKFKNSNNFYTLIPTEKNFECNFYNKELFYNGDLFTTKFQSKFKQSNPLLKKVSKVKFNAPFFINPLTNELVQNDELKEKIDLDEYMNYITRFDVKEEDKLISIIKFIQENNQLILDYPSEIEELSDADIKTLVLTKKSKIQSWKFAQIVKKLSGFLTIKLHRIRGIVKSTKHFNSSRLHEWFLIENNNSLKLCDPVSGLQWMNVDPELMIMTHFPFEEKYQNLESPISMNEFESMPILEVMSERIHYIDMIPSAKRIQIKDELKLLFNNGIYKLKIYNWDENDPQNLNLETNYTTVSSGGKTMITIPIYTNNSRLFIEINDEYSVNFEVVKSIAENSEIANFYSTLPKTNFQISKKTVPQESNLNNESKVRNERLTLFDYDLIQLNVYQNEILNHPLIKKVSTYYGLRDIEGKENNQQILVFFKETGHNDVKDDETSWCSVFMAYCAKELNQKYPKSATARSWLDQGVKVKKPLPGDLVIFWRESPNSWKGHVGIYLGYDKVNDEIITLGGNQDDMVKIKKYPANQVLGYRRILTN